MRFVFIILERGRGKEGECEEERIITLSFRVFMHLLILVCALTGYQTRNPGELGWCSIRLNQPARPTK